MFFIAWKAPTLHPVRSGEVTPRKGLVSTCIPFLYSFSYHLLTAIVAERIPAKWTFILTQHGCRRSVRYDTVAQYHLILKKTWPFTCQTIMQLALNSLALCDIQGHFYYYSTVHGNTTNTKGALSIYHR